MTRKERNIRAAIAWRLFAVGDAITRGAHQVCDEIPTVESASNEWIDSSYRAGHRAGVREAAAIITGGAR